MLRLVLYASFPRVMTPTLNKAACQIIRHDHANFLGEFTVDGYIRLADFHAKFHIPRPDQQELLDMLRSQPRRFRLELDRDRVIWVSPVHNHCSNFEMPRGSLPPLVGHNSPPHARIQTYGRQVQEELQADRQQGMMRRQDANGSTSAGSADDDDHVDEDVSDDEESNSPASVPYAESCVACGERSNNPQQDLCKTCGVFLESTDRLAAYPGKQLAEIDAEEDKKDLSWHELWDEKPANDCSWEYLGTGDNKWKWVKWIKRGNDWDTVDWNGLPDAHPVPLGLADLAKLEIPVPMPAARLLPPHRGPRNGPKRPINFATMEARGREAWRQQQKKGYDVIGPPMEVWHRNKKIICSGVLRRSRDIRVTEKHPDNFFPQRCLRINDEGTCICDPWIVSMDETSARRGIHVIDGPQSFFYPGPSTIAELTATHFCLRNCLFGEENSWDWCYFTYQGHFLDEGFWVPVGITLCVLQCGKPTDAPG